MIHRQRFAHEVRCDEADESDNAHLPTAAAVASETMPSSVSRSAGSDSPSDWAVSSPSVSASRPRDRRDRRHDAHAEDGAEQADRGPANEAGAAE